MNVGIWGWIIIVLLIFSSLLSLTMIGKPRKPITRSDVAFTTLLNIVLIILILTGGLK